MIRSSIRGKLLFAVTLLVGASAVITTAAVVGVLSWHADRSTDLGLERGLQAAHAFHSMREELMEDQAFSLAATPFLQATMRIPELDAATAEHAARSLADAAGSDVLLLESAGHDLLACIPSVPEARASIVSIVSSEDRPAGVYRIDGEAFLTWRVPIYSGEALTGWLTLGTRIGGPFIDDLEVASGHAIRLFAGSEQLGGRDGSHWPRATATDLAQHQARRSEEVLSLRAGDLNLRTRVDRLGDSGLWFSASQSMTEARQTYRDTALVIVTVALISLLGACLVARQVARRLAHPILELERTAKSIENGDLDVPVHVRTRDEVGSLAKTFRAMVERLRALVEEVRAKALAAEEASVAKTQFLTVMSHELRTPLNALIGVIRCVNDEGRGHIDRERMEILDGSSRELLFKINDILDYSGLREGCLQLRPNEADLREVVDEIIITKRHLARDKGLAIDVRVDNEIATAGIFDKDRLRQALGHLIENAIKYTEQGSVDVRLVEGQATNVRRSFVVEVSDTGPGIAPEDQQRIFDHFAQADGSDTRAHGGTGLGLALARGILEFFGGTVTLKSRLGEGSTFSAHFEIDPPRTLPPSVKRLAGEVHLDPNLEPSGLAHDLRRLGVTVSATSATLELRAGEQGLELASGDKEPVFLPTPPTLAELRAGLLRQLATEQTEEDRGLDLRILAVDDNATNLKVLQLHLGRLGCTVETAAQGVEALAHVAKSSFDVVLMDCQMPVMDGFEATRRIRDSHPAESLPIIAVTAGVDAADRDRCFESGMTDFLAKPVDRDRLRSALQAAANSAARADH